MRPSVTARDRTHTDRITIVMFVFLVLGGLTMLYSVGRPAEGYTEDYAGMLNTLFGKQLIWAMISMIAWFFVNLFVDRKVWVSGAYPIYGATIVLLLLVLLVGKEINNARSWFSVAGMTFQPSELAKFGTCLAMAAYLSQWREKLDSWKPIFNGALLWIVPAGLIILQPDPGSALVFSAFLLVMYREGLPPLLLIFGIFTSAMFLLGVMFPTGLLVGVLLALLLLLLSLRVPRRKRLWLLGAAGSAIAAGSGFYLGLGWPILLGLSLAFIGTVIYHFLRQNSRLASIAIATLVWGGLIAGAANFAFNNVLRPHQQDRIDAWLRPERLDERGALYNIIQAKLAIAAGGVWGKGRFEGTMTRYDYVPEQETDFIFTAIGEEEGFVGVTLLIIGYIGFLWRLSIIAERQRRSFARAFGYGVVSILLLHLLVNVGMTMGLMPVIGIPLPFISKGGSSLLSFTLMVAVLLKLDRHREAV